MANVEEKAELTSVIRDDPDAVSLFLSLGRDYLSDLLASERERFLQSILARQEEPDRWLLFLRYGGDCIGFFHLKIDRDERPGWVLYWNSTSCQISVD